MVGLEDNRVEEVVIKIKVKYNSYWRTVPRARRKKYELENQNTLRVECDNSSLKIFGEKVDNSLNQKCKHFCIRTVSSDSKLSSDIKLRLGLLLQTKASTNWS